MIPGARGRGARLALELACAALALLPLAHLAGGRCPSGGDLQTFFLPQLWGLEQALGAGALRAWEPAWACGYPALAALQAGSCYPPLLLPLLLGLSHLQALQLALLLHGWLLARGTVALVRELGGSRRAGLLAAASLLLGGSAAGHLGQGHLTVVVVLGWLPWVLVAAARAGRRGGASAPLLLGAACGAALLAPHPQFVWFQALLALLLAATVADRGRRVGALLRVSAGLALAGALAAPQLVPTAEYMAWNARPHPEGTWRFVSEHGMRWRDLPAWILGQPLPDAPHVLFPGTACWALALLGLSAAGARGALARAGLLCAALGLFLCPGGANPVWRLLAHLPPFDLFRVPARYALLSSVGLALLAAAGVDALLRGRVAPRSGAWGLGAAAALPVAALLGSAGLGLGHGPARLVLPGLTLVALAASALASGARLRRAGLTAALLLLLVELAAAHAALVPTRPLAELEAPPRLAAPIATSSNPRTLDLAGHFGVSWDEQARRLRRNAGARFGVEYFSGYEALPPLDRELLTRELEALGPSPELIEACRRLSIRWLVLDQGAGGGLAGLRRVDQDAGVELWEVEGARPRCYLLARGGGAPREVPLTRPWPGALRIERIETEGPARLVLGEAWYPGWTAELDGATVLEEDLVRAEGLFMALELPPGRHRVELRFESASVAIGLRLGAAAWLAWATGLWLLWRRGRAA